MMIRVNLLPRRKEHVHVFGIDVDVEHVRQMTSGVVLAALVAGIGVGLERVRIEHLAALVHRDEALLADHAAARADAKRLALDVARYQTLARETTLLGASGRRAAVEIARVGNALPNTVWLDHLEHDSHGYALTGDARSVGAVGDAIDSLSASFAAARTSLGSVDASAHDAAVRFSARIDEARARQ